MTDPNTSYVDDYLNNLRESRDSSAVLKIRLASVRADLPNIAIFVFEGDDDKIIYYQWIRRVSEGLVYEPFACGGKREIKKLKSLLSRDLSNLSENIYFFVDRDFDDLAGFVNQDNIFMTDCYSVENYLVNESVLDECLKSEFPCDGRPRIRKLIREHFETAYTEFIIETKEINRRLFFSRRLGIKLTERLPDKIGKLALVSITCVKPSGYLASDLVCFNDLVDLAKNRILHDEFEALDARRRYRGKFSLLFFKKWLERLVAEYNNPEIGVFGTRHNTACVRAAELTLSNFASRSSLPVGLSEFIASVQSGMVQGPRFSPSSTL